MNVTREIVMGPNNNHEHFLEIESKYKWHLRTTDSGSILHIKNQLHQKPKIILADADCDDGRYSLEFLNCLGEKHSLHCIGSNENNFLQMGKDI